MLWFECMMLRPSVAFVINHQTHFSWFSFQHLIYLLNRQQNIKKIKIPTSNIRDKNKQSTILAIILGDLLTLSKRIVWTSLKMSHFNFSFLAFSTNFSHIIFDKSGNTIWPQASGLAIDVAGISNENADVARFGCNVVWDIFVIFKHRVSVWVYKNGCSSSLVETSCRQSLVIRFDLKPFPRGM